MTCSPAHVDSVTHQDQLLRRFSREREINEDSAEEKTRDMCFGHPQLTPRAVDNCNCFAFMNLSCLHEEPFVDLLLHEDLREHPSPKEIETAC